MGLLKTRPNSSRINVLPQLVYYFHCGKNCSKIWATFEIFQRLPEVNNRPIGENSPNLVTLLESWTMCYKSFRVPEQVFTEESYFLGTCGSRLFGNGKFFSIFFQKVARDGGIRDDRLLGYGSPNLTLISP
jgi:hypothetical protein